MVENTDADIHRRINALIAEEHKLREEVDSGPDGERRERLTFLEAQLDQAWDLLRQRQARREWDQDPERAHERPARVVENYEN